LENHPSPRIKKPGEPTHRVQYLRREEFADLLAAAPPWLRPMLQLAVHAGLRLKEATGLRWEDVDLRGGLLYVNPDSKTGRPDPVRLTDSAIRVLRDLHDRRRALARTLGVVINDVFVDDDGENFHDEPSRIRISKLTQRIMTAIGRPDYGFITLRHTTASWLAQAGVDLARIREHMRHTNIQTTLRYAHLRPKHLDDVVEALDASAASGHNMDTPQAATDGVAVSR
jgi:integrase